VRTTLFIFVTFLLAAGACTIENDPFVPTIDATDAPDGPPDILLSTTEVRITEGEIGAFDVRLRDAPPVSPAILEVLVDDESVARPSVSILSFTAADFATIRHVEVSGVDDLDTLSETATITLRGVGFLARTVSVSVTDNDLLAIESNPDGAGNVLEGATASLQVWLSAQPSGPIMVAANSSDIGTLTVSPPVLTFNAANWSNVQLVTVSGVEDVDAVNDTASVSLGAAGIPTKTIAYTIYDND
jgi:hypothetical protein